MTGSPHWHAAVVGGGPAGLAVAIALAHEGLTALVLELTDYDRPRVGEHLAPRAKDVLGSLRISDLLQTGEHLPCPGVRSAWGTSRAIDKDYLFSPNGDGVNLSRPEFDCALAARAASLGARVATRSKLSGVARTGGCWDLRYEQDGAAFTATADFVVDATGRAASVAKRLGARPIVYDDLVGLIRHAAPADADRRVYIEALPQGWWYSTRLKGDTIVAAFMTDSDLLDLAGGHAAAWDRALAASGITRARTRPPVQPCEVHLRSARTQRLDHLHGEGWLAVGDAAMSYDPLSSEGIAKGLDWGGRAARTIAAVLRGERRAGEGYAEDAARTFSAYLHERRRFYAAEARWRDPFWSRRQQPRAHAPQAAI